jgi:hypothetical protein
MDLTRRHVPGLSETQSERCERAAMLLMNDWSSKFGPLKDCSVSARNWAQENSVRWQRNVTKQILGASYGFAVFSMHVEASYLPGNDAKTVYDLSKAAISMWPELARKMDRGDGA